MQELWAQFKRDLNKNWKMSAALGVLFLFGCCIWIPMALKAAAPRRAQTVSNTANPTAVTPSTSAASGNSTASHDNEGFWSSLSKSLESDPLFRPCDMTSAIRDPFSTDESEVPLPVLFAEDFSEVVSPVVEANTEIAPTGLELRSTMVGRTRRAAIINDQLYHIGRSVEANGKVFLLASIESDRVILTAGEKSFELTLARPKLENVLNRERAADFVAPPNP